MWGHIALICALLSATGCYGGVQRASYVSTAKSSDSSSAGASVSADVYELVVGTRYQRYWLFGGLGVGPKRGGATSGAGATPIDDRAHLGVAVDIVKVGRLRFSGVGLIAAALTTGILYKWAGIEDDGTGEPSSLELGLEVALDTYFGKQGGLSWPFLRMSYGTRSGMTGSGSDSNALIVTFGFNTGYWMDKR